MFETFYWFTHFCLEILSSRFTHFFRRFFWDWKVESADFFVFRMYDTGFHAPTQSRTEHSPHLRSIPSSLCKDWSIQNQFLTLIIFLQKVHLLSTIFLPKEGLVAPRRTVFPFRSSSLRFQSYIRVPPFSHSNHHLWDFDHIQVLQWIRTDPGPQGRA